MKKRILIGTLFLALLVSGLGLMAGDYASRQSVLFEIGTATW